MRRTTPHRNIQYVWQKLWLWRKPYKCLRRGRIDERICWRYIVLRRYLATLTYLKAVPDLVTLIHERTLDWIFTVQYRRYYLHMSEQ